MTYIITLFNKMAHYFNIKALMALGLLCANFLFDGGQIPVYIALALLIMGDSAAGIYASVTKGAKIESAKLRRTATKFVVYFGMVAAGHLAEYGLMPIAGILDESIAGYLIATELISILENLGRAGYVVPVRAIALLQRYVAGDEEKNLTRN